MKDDEQKELEEKKIEALRDIAYAIKKLAETIEDLKPEPAPEPEKTIYSPRPPVRADLELNAGAQAYAKLEELKKIRDAMRAAEKKKE
jgi:hypothetical protein